MRAVVFGASGRTGRLVVAGLLDRGHQVTAISRDPASAGLPQQARTHRGDLLDPESISGVTADADVVISTIGPDDGRAPTTVYSQGITAILAEMRANGPTRLVALSAVPVGDPRQFGWFQRRVVHPILWRFFGPSYRDLRLMEATLSAGSGIDWAIVRPPMLTDGPPGRPTRSQWDQPLPRTSRISRLALAETLVGLATGPQFRTGVLTVSE